MISAKKNSDPLRLPEVQAAMSSRLQSNASEWATPDLLDSISKRHPNLASGISNPRYMHALREMQANPKQTLDRLKSSDPEIFAWLTEFCGVMGEHFCKLGERQTNEQKTAVTEEGKVREMGPLEEKALRKHQKDRRTCAEGAAEWRPAEACAAQPCNQPSEGNNETDEEVASILGNEELRALLLDPTVQRIMEELSSSSGGAKLWYYMSHAEHGPKLRKLIEAGLLRLA